MEITLIINPSSSSKKFALYKDGVRLVDAYVEGGADGYNTCTIMKGVQQQCEPVNRSRFRDSLANFLKQIVEEKIIASLMDIKIVAIRVVAPGTFFQEHKEIDSEYIKKLHIQADTAPLHIPSLLKEIEVIKKQLPQARLIGVSDTAFHCSIPDFIRSYSLPKADAKQYDLYRFGHHGLSVVSVVERVHAVTGFDPKRMIVCHIGSGVSVTAVKDGKSFDTSSGYAPGSGLIMSSRAGDLDAGAILALMKKQNLKPIDAENYIQTQGGLFGLSGEVDLRLLIERRVHGDIMATKAINSFVYQIQKTIGAFVAVLGGLDLLVFTATAGERSSALRSLITEQLLGLGIVLDTEKNDLCIGKNGVISQVGSQIKVAVIKNDETAEIIKIVKTL
jgi:acetate kinase